MIRLAASLAVLVLSVGAAGADPASDAAGTASKAADAVILTGPIGAVFMLAVIGMGAACTALWIKLGRRDALIAELQEKRIEDAKSTIKDVVASSITSAGAIADSNKRLADHDTRIQGLTEKLSTLPENITRISANQEKILEFLRRSPVPGGAA